MRNLVSAICLICLAAVADSTAAQTALANDRPRVMIGGGYEFSEELHGLSLGVDVGVAGPWTVDVSQTLSYTARLEPGQFSDFSGGITHTLAIGFRPVRWFNVYGGPAWALRTVRHNSLARPKTTVDTYQRTSTIGAAAGATVRLYARSFRFYTAGLHGIWLPNQSLVKKADMAAAFGAGIAF